MWPAHPRQGPLLPTISAWRHREMLVLDDLPAPRGTREHTKDPGSMKEAENRDPDRRGIPGPSHRAQPLFVEGIRD
jgi:hypothetical protein